MTRLSINLTIDFAKSILHGYTDVEVTLQKDNASHVNLDAKTLSIEKVFILGDTSEVHYTIPKHSHLGYCLCIPLPSQKYRKGDIFTIRVYYHTAPNAGGIQWFEPKQTSGKVHPFMYTQFEAILSRTMIPNMDTPSVKCPYDITLSCPSPLICVASANLKTSSKQGDLNIFTFDQPMPIPSYLIALACGALVNGKIGPRSQVWCEKELLEASVKEFDQTETYLQAGEKICQYPYDWKTYDLLILPSAFPYGGMENPQLTFISSSLITGDKALTAVVAHEITHSWAGNLVTNGGWVHFWLNEGFTMYIERLILGEVFDDKYRQFEHILGYGELIKACDELSKDPNLTKLVPDLTGIDPDDAFSRIPYEKGCLFLLYLESSVGRESFLKWIRLYISDFAKKSLTSDEMKTHFLANFKDIKVDWDAWFYEPGLPKWNPNDYLDQTLNKECQGVVSKWMDQNGQNTSQDDLKWHPVQTMVFLDYLINSKHKFDEKKLEKMGEMYRFSETNNVEILFRWLMLNLCSHQVKILPQVEIFVSKHGRGIYLRPLYNKLHELASNGLIDMSHVKQVYTQNRGYYHSVIKNSFDKKLLL